MQDLCAKGIVDSISTALCSTLHSDLICYIIVNLEHIYPKGKRQEFMIRGIMRIPPVYLKTSLS